MFQATASIRRCRNVLAVSASLALLAACGGGGGTSAPTGPVTSTLSLPLQTGYSTLIANGAANNFTISGTCAGSGSHTEGAANTATTFEGSAALSAASTWTMTFTTARRRRPQLLPSLTTTATTCHAACRR